MPRILIAAFLLVMAMFAVTLRREAPAEDRKRLFPGARIDSATLSLFERACQNCHSGNTKWPWYSRIPPASWMIRKDVEEARRHVNFSEWDRYTTEKQEELLTRIGSEVRSGQMPLPRYVFVHREAALRPRERGQIYEWTRTERRRLRARGDQTGL
jgi:hypothetical protein